jgi:DNA invertase Pin-like site-specific DNA recombinase
MAMIGYARVSTGGQELEPQLRALRAAGCHKLVEERASGAASRARPELARLLARIRRGDTLIVVRLDRLARSLGHLIEVVERLRAAGAHLRSLSDPVDTAGPGGMLVLQIMGAIAQFERALIIERTRAGLAAARARGRVGGNPGLRTRDPSALGRLAAARERTRLANLLPGLDEWLPAVRAARPQRSWAEAADWVNSVLPPGRRRFTRDRLVRAVRLLVREGLAEPALLGRASPTRRRPARAAAASRRAMEVATAFANGREEPVTLAEVGAQLLRMRVPPPGGGEAWPTSSVKALLDRARATGLLQEGKGARTRRRGCRPAAAPPAAGTAAGSGAGGGGGAASAAMPPLRARRARGSVAP